MLTVLLIPELLAGALASRERHVLARRNRHTDTVPLPMLHVRV